VPVTELAVSFVNRTATESEQESWTLTLVLTARPPPRDGETALRLELKPVSYTERALVDGDQIVTRRLVLQNQQPFVESPTVSFVDANGERVEERTTVHLELFRSRGFVAGEYGARVSSAVTGDLLGEAPIELLGDNPLVDRRSGAFAARIPVVPPRPLHEAAGGEPRSNPLVLDSQHAITNETTCCFGGGGSNGRRQESHSRARFRPVSFLPPSRLADGPR
jgi:hypothetical protein